jgi:hypothetical protein
MHLEVVKKVQTLHNKDLHHLYMFSSVVRSVKSGNIMVGWTCSSMWEMKCLLCCGKWILAL